MLHLCRKLLLFACVGLTPNVLAHTLINRAGSYSDDNGLNRNRLQLNLDLNFTHFQSGLTGTTYNVSATQDQYERETLETSDGVLKHANNNLSVSATQVWNKTTETRVNGGMSSDKELESRSQSFGAGVGQWLWHDSLRLGVDMQRSIAKQPADEYLDYDSQLVTVPTSISTTGTTFSLRHLATTTTITDYAVGYFDNENRPGSTNYSFNVKQFIPPFKGAVHAGVVRAVNRGKIQRNTTYGEVDAWEATVAYLQTLWKGATSRLGYKYYQENQTTRAYKDELVFGSDLYSLNLSQEIDRFIIDGGASYYQTNKDNNSVAIDNTTKIAARIYEVGLSARF
jgi:hypothetical protein